MRLRSGRRARWARAGSPKIHLSPDRLALLSARASPMRPSKAAASGAWWRRNAP
jgi:hypothetical protein